MIPQVMQALMVLGALFIASASATPCPHPCKCFTTDNGIQAANCTHLPDQMTTTWPQKILRIHFETDRASTVMLKNKAFKNFPRLTYLDITGGTIHYVGNSAFDGLPELVELNLVGTGIRKLHRNTFASNRKLAFLSLSKNPRLFVAPSFLVSESITELDLSECALTTLKSVYFKSLPNLKYLFAMKNQLKVLGSQFGPSGIKFVNLAHNQIEYIYEDLEAYKRLRTIDLTGNPINCTCELSEIDKKLSSRGVAFGNSITCNTGKPLGDMIEVCSDKEMMGDDPMDNIYKEDHLLKIQKSGSVEEIEVYGSGSGSGDSEITTINIIPPPPQIEIKDVKNNTKIDEVKNNTQVEEFITKTEVGKTFELPETKTTSVEPITVAAASTETTSVEPITVAVASTETTSVEPIIVVVVSTETTSVEPITVAVASTETTSVEPIIVVVSSTEKTADTTVPPEVTVHVQPSVNPPDSSNSSRIQAPEDEDVRVHTRIADYVKSNYELTGIAVILLIVIIAIVYKAVCFGRSRSHSMVANSEKSVELKNVKYEAANTDDTPDNRDGSPASSVEDDRLLADRESDDEDDSNGPNEDDNCSVVAMSSSPATNGRHGQNGLLNSVMDAMKNNVEPATKTAPGGQDVPTRVIVKMCETPKASKPITINNVH